MLTEWKRLLITRRADRLLTLRKIDALVAERHTIPDAFIGLGDKGTDVRLLQKLLAARGYFPKERVSGLFGAVTREAVLAYQLATGLLTSSTDKGAGFVGPATLAKLKHDERKALFHLVRAQGWGAL